MLEVARVCQQLFSFYEGARRAARCMTLHLLLGYPAAWLSCVNCPLKPCLFVAVVIFTYII